MMEMGRKEQTDHILFIRNDTDESTGTKLAKHIHTCFAYFPLWCFVLFCFVFLLIIAFVKFLQNKFMHPGKTPELFSWLSRSNQSSPAHFSESSACCTKTRIQSPLTSGSPGGGPPSTIFAPSWLCLLTFIRVGKNVQKSNVPGRTWLVQSLFPSIFTDFFLFFSFWF